MLTNVASGCKKVTDRIAPLSAKNLLDVLWIKEMHDRERTVYVLADDRAVFCIIEVSAFMQCLDFVVSCAPTT